MTATAAQITLVRAMVAEPTTTNFSDATVKAYIEAYPLMDEQGEVPYTLSSATPPAQVVNVNWIPTYDLNAAAADIWDAKAALYADKFDFSADGGNYSRSQVYEQMQSRARYYRSRRSPKSVTLIKWPEETRGDKFLWIGNLPEDDD